MKSSFPTILFSVFLTFHFSCSAYGDNHELISTITDQIALEPGNAALLVKRAAMYVEVIHYDKALIDLEAATAIEGSNYPPALLLFARTFYHMNNYEMANAYLDQFLDIKHVHIRGLQLKARILEKQGDLNQAVDYYKKVLVHSRQHSIENYLVLIDNLHKIDRQAEAIFYCKSAIRHFGDSELLQSKLAVLTAKH